MNRNEQVKWVRRTMTVILGRGARIHTYTVAELKDKVRQTVESSHWAGFQFPKDLLDFIK